MSGDITRPMRIALAMLLLDGDAALAGEPFRETFRTPCGRTIDGQTIKALARRALGHTAGPRRDRFTLTTAGRRAAIALQSGTPS